MPQVSLKTFARACLAGTSDVGDAEVARAAAAAKVGLVWPRPGCVEKPGRPSWQEKWTDALYAAVACDRALPPGTQNLQSVHS